MPLARFRQTAERVAAAADDIGAAGRSTADTMRTASLALAAVAAVALVALLVAAFALVEVRRA